jgi:hypothetical protein
MNHLVNSF